MGKSFTDRALLSAVSLMVIGLATSTGTILPNHAVAADYKGVLYNPIPGVEIGVPSTDTPPVQIFANGVLY